MVVDMRPEWERAMDADPRWVPVTVRGAVVGGRKRLFEKGENVKVLTTQFQGVRVVGEYAVGVMTPEYSLLMDPYAVSMLHRVKRL